MPALGDTRVTEEPGWLWKQSIMDNRVWFPLGGIAGNPHGYRPASLRLLL